MKTIFLFILLCLFSISPARAGTVAGFGGGTEYTQILNNVQLANSYTQMLTNYTTQLQQYQAQLQNLQRNPLSPMAQDIPNMIKGIGSVMTAGKSIGGSMASIDSNFASTFKSPLAQNYSDRFKSLTDTSQDTLNASAKAAGIQRDAMDSETAVLDALYTKSQSSDGTVAAIQQLSAINTNQIQHLQGLKELISTQNIASSTWMATQNAKDEAKVNSSANEIKNTMTIVDQPMPAPRAKDKSHW